LREWDAVARIWLLGYWTDTVLASLACCGLVTLVPAFFYYSLRYLRTGKGISLRHLAAASMLAWVPSVFGMTYWASWADRAHRLDAGFPWPFIVHLGGCDPYGLSRPVIVLDIIVVYALAFVPLLFCCHIASRLTRRWRRTGGVDRATERQV
jgi:hypothetical protein